MNTYPLIRRLGVLPATMTSPVLGSRQAVAAMWARHPDQVKRHCTPIACDVRTRAPIYDADDAGVILKGLRRRVA